MPNQYKRKKDIVTEEREKREEEELRLKKYLRVKIFLKQLGEEAQNASLHGASSEEGSYSPNSKTETLREQAETVNPYSWMKDSEEQRKSRSKSPPQVRSPEKKIQRITKHLNQLEKTGDIDKLRKAKLMSYI